MSQEMRPYLSFSGLDTAFIASQQPDSIGMAFSLNLENVGKCVLSYETTQFDVFINNVQLPNVQTKSTGAVIGINTKGTYNRFYSGISPLPTDCRVIFSIEYFRINMPKKKYKLSYEILLEIKENTIIVLYGKSSAN